MRGHLPIITMRRQGARPSHVFLDTEPCGVEQWRHWPEDSPHIATVWIEPEDIVARLDLRYLVGLTVSVTGCDGDRVQAVAEACQEADADRVIAVVCELQHRGFDTLARVVSITDTGAL